MEIFTFTATKSKICFLSFSKGLHKSKKWISSSICLIYGYPHIHTHFRMTVDLYVEVLIYCHWLRQISLKTIHTCILAEMNLHFPKSDFIAVLSDILVTRYLVFFVVIRWSLCVCSSFLLLVIVLSVFD
jgi:hypothetical protein